jgi:hypothetical protein
LGARRTLQTRSCHFRRVVILFFRSLSIICVSYDRYGAYWTGTSAAYHHGRSRGKRRGAHGDGGTGVHDDTRRWSGWDSAPPPGRGIGHLRGASHLPKLHHRGPWCSRGCSSRLRWGHTLLRSRGLASQLMDMPSGPHASAVYDDQCPRVVRAVPRNLYLIQLLTRCFRTSSGAATLAPGRPIASTGTGRWLCSGCVTGDRDELSAAWSQPAVPLWIFQKLRTTLEGGHLRSISVYFGRTVAPSDLRIEKRAALALPLAGPASVSCHRGDATGSWIPPCDTNGPVGRFQGARRIIGLYCDVQEESVSRSGGWPCVSFPG